MATRRSRRQRYAATLGELWRAARWPVILVAGLLLAIEAGTWIGEDAAATMNPFYANVVAAADNNDAAPLTEIDDTPPAIAYADNAMPAVAPVDASYARAAASTTAPQGGETAR